MASTDNRKSHVLGALCFLITLGILLAGLWPFDANPVNKVEWLQDMNGIRFYGQGIVTPSAPRDILKPLLGNGSVSIELMIRPEQEKPDYVASILTFLDSRGAETFFVGQWKSHLIIRSLLKDGSGRERFYEWGLDNVLQRDAIRLLTITSGTGGTILYLDGIRKSSYARKLLFPNMRKSMDDLILGTSPSGAMYWTGSLFGLAMYDRSLNGKEVLYSFQGWRNHGQPQPAKDITLSADRKSSVNPDVQASQETQEMLRSSEPGVLGFGMEERKPVALFLFDERGGRQIRNHADARNHLVIPPTFQPPYRTILGVPAKDQWLRRWNLSDIAINALGFAPFGFFLSAWLLKAKNIAAPRAYAVTVLLGFCLCLAIELAQGYLPTRDSSLMDVFSNTLGTAAGVFLLIISGRGIDWT